MKISVIVPVFNESEHISKTLDSILNQNFNDYEIIVVDDGSSDNSLEIIEDKLRDSQIPSNIIHQKNQGVGSARNTGIKHATGEYIVFVDGDDYILTNHLNELYNPDYDFALTQLTKNENDKLHIYDCGEMDAYDFIKDELEMKIPFNFCQLSYKMDLIKKNNLQFREDVVYGEDTDFALKALSYGDKIKISNEITYYYLQHDSSAINTSRLKRFEFIQVLDDLKEFFKKHELFELAGLIDTSRIPKAIFGNMNYFFYNDYDFDDIMSVMHDLNLFDKLSRFKGDWKFNLKIRLFIIAPKIYYTLWKKFKNTI